ncbi:TonB-dependent receptor domain-containing protein [Candidatus Eisenbacteria bacterium]|uniref:TonB-dependent receptor domain-containing protein n=1 Tax=Eiseniibacteriota bacterium TaxID=2212470 RepID=A0ABV6YPQ6_UNCEI
MRRPAFCVIAGLIVVLFACSVQAGTTGKIAGMVIDADTGEPLFAVNVMVENTTLGGITNLEGLYHVVNLPPGTYSVKATMMGYQAMVKDRVIVSTDLTTPIDFVLNPAVLDVVPEIVVTAERPMIRKDVTSSVTIVDREEIAMLPVESPFDIVAYQTGAAADRRGLHVRGGRETELSYTVNGTSILDPIFSRASASYDEAAIQEMVIHSGGFNPEYGNAQSAVVNVITREGGLRFKGQLDLGFYLPVESLWESAGNASRYDTGFKTAKLTFSGPTPWTNQLRYFISGETTRWDDWDPHIYTLPNQGRDRDQLIWKVTGFPGNSMKLFFEGIYYDTQFNRWDAQRQKAPESFLGYDRGTFMGMFGLSHMISNNTYYDVSASRFETDYHVAQPDKWWDMSQSQEWNTTPEDEGGGGLNLSPEYDEDNFIVSGDNPLFHQSNTEVYSLRTSITSQANSHHQVKVGGEIARYKTLHQEVYAPPGNIYRNEYLVKPVYGVLYAQDKVEYSGLIVNFGARFDYFDPNVKLPSDPVYPWDPEIQVPGPEGGGPDNTEPPLWNLVDVSPKVNISPRLGISHPVGNTSVLHFTYGHYYQIPAFGYLYTNTKYDMGGHWPLIGNPDLKPEQTVSYEVGIEHLLNPDLMLDVTGFYKDIDNLISTQVVNNSKDPDTPADAVEYTTYDNTDWGNVRGMEFTMQQRFREDWMGRLMYTYMIAKGRSSDVIEGYLNHFADNVPPTKEYYLDWDRRHTVILDLGYGRRGNWAINMLVRYASGSPYTPAENTRSAQPEQNTARFPNTSTVNMKLTKEFHFRESNQQVFMEIYNLFDKKNLVGFDDDDTDLMRHLRYTGEWTGPYNDVTVYGPPREIRAGFKIGF